MVLLLMLHFFSFLKAEQAEKADVEKADKPKAEQTEAYEEKKKKMKAGKPKAGKPKAEQTEVCAEKKKAEQTEACAEKTYPPYPFPDSIEAFVYFLPFLYHRGRLKL